jgi:hypothetical protein
MSLSCPRKRRVAGFQMAAHEKLLNGRVPAIYDAGFAFQDA